MTRLVNWVLAPVVALVDTIGRRVDAALFDEEDQW